jgi:hypothetical protein
MFMKHKFTEERSLIFYLKQGCHLKMIGHHFYHNDEHIVHSSFGYYRQYIVN